MRDGGDEFGRSHAGSEDPRGKDLVHPRRYRTGTGAKVDDGPADRHGRGIANRQLGRYGNIRYGQIRIGNLLEQDGRGDLVIVFTAGFEDLPVAVADDDEESRPARAEGQGRAERPGVRGVRCRGASVSDFAEPIAAEVIGTEIDNVLP